MPAKDQRARSRAAGVPNSGLGRMKDLLAWRRKSWAEVQPVAEHVADLQVLMTQASTSGSTGYITFSLAAPVEYMEDATQVAMAGIAGALFMRVYVVTPDTFKGDEFDAEEG